MVSSTSTYYKVNVTESVGAYSLSYLFKVETSGTVDWEYSSILGHGSNVTGAQAESTFVGATAFFQLEAGSNQVYSYALIAQYFHATGTGTVTIPSVTISYTTYVANSPNESFNYCGSSFTYSEFSVEIGTVQGTSDQVLASLTIVGTEGSTPVDVTIQLTGLTLA